MRFDAPAALPARQMEQQALATFVVSVDSQSAPAEVDAVAQAPQHDLPFAILLASAFTLFTLAVNGYHPYAEDGGLYLAGAKRLLDPALYPDSTAFVIEPTRFSLFAPMVAEIITLSHLTVPIALLALHLASIWATLFAAWMLASRCWITRSGRAGAVALLACWLSVPVAGTALVLMDPYLSARSISTPCMILALVGVLDCTERNRLATKHSRRWGLCLWIASILLASATHPLMAAYALGGTMALACLGSADPRVKLWASAALVAAALAIAACLQHVASPENADYRHIALTRTYWFPAEWSWYELIGLAAPLLILAFSACRNFRMPSVDFIRAVPSRRALAQAALAIGAIAWMVAMFFARAGAPIHLVARIQPLRAFHLVYFVMILFLGANLGESILKNISWRWAATLLVIGGVMFAVERNSFPNSQHIESPWSAPSNQWVQAFLWIRENTPRDAFFALDADYINAPGEDAQCFRAIAERSSLPDYSKDGGEASIAPQLTALWKIGQQAQQGLSAPATTDSMRISALNPLGVSWLVLDHRAATNFNCPYANAAVKVCRLR